MTSGTWPASPRHSPTLESGRGFQDRGPAIELQRPIVSQDANAQDVIDRVLVSMDEDSRFHHALSLYRSVKHRRRSDLFRDIVEIGTIGMRNNANPPNTQANDSTFPYSTSDSISETFAKIYNEFNKSKTGLRLCAISAQPYTARNPYGHRSRALHWITGRQREAGHILQAITLALLTETWASNWIEREMIANLLSSQTMSEAHPALSPISTNATLTMYPLDPQSSAQLRRPLEFGDWTNTIYFQWQWLRECPKYNGNFDIYVRQPHCERPLLDYIRLIMMREGSSTSSSQRETRKILAVASSCQVLRRFWDLQFVPNAEPIRLPDLDSELIRSICKVYILIWSDTSHLVSEISKSIEDIDRRRRKSPSGPKDQYLQHLEDCVADIVASMKANITIIDQVMLAISAQLPSTHNTLYTYIDDLAASKNDLQTLIDDLKGKTTITSKIRAAMKDQLDYSNRFRNTAIGILVAIYVPLSFATALFGMNIADTSMVKYNTTTSVREQGDWAHTLTMTSTNQPGTRTWALNTFFETAIPLTFATIIIPISLGPTIRGVSRFAGRHPRWWRVINATVIFLVIAGLLLLSLFVGMAHIIVNGVLFIFCGVHVFLAFGVRRATVKPIYFWTSCVALIAPFSLSNVISLLLTGFAIAIAMIYAWRRGMFWYDLRKIKT